MNAIQTRIDAIIHPILNTVAPAVSLAVMYQGELLLEGSWGVIDPETSEIPVTVSTLFDLASLTKLFTSTALFSLLSREGLTVHTPLVEFIPEFGTENPRPIDGGQDPHNKQHQPTPEHLIGETVNPEDVTLWHLLTHTSGLPPWRDVFNVAPAPVPPDEADPTSPEERWKMGLERLCIYPFVEHIGKAVRYSDIGLMLLGEVVARLNKSDLATTVKTHVLDPLRVGDMMFNPVRDHGIKRELIAPTEIDATWRKRRVWGEVHDENACGVGGVAGHAGLFGTAQSVAIFGQAWLEWSRFPLTHTLWQQATSEQANTDGERRGLGWMLRSRENSSAGNRMSGNTFGHTGFTGTSLWIDPAYQLVVALMTNRVFMGRSVPGIHPLRQAVHDTIVEMVV